MLLGAVPKFRPLIRSHFSTICYHIPARWPAPSWPDSSTGWALHRHRWSLGSIPFQGPVSRKSRNFSGDRSLFITSKWRRSETRNIAVILIFVPFTTHQKTSFQHRISGSEFYKWLFGPKSFRDFWETGPRSEFSGLSFAAAPTSIA